MEIKKVATNDIGFLKELMVKFFNDNKHNRTYVTNARKKIFSLEGSNNLGNFVIGKYVLHKKEVVNLSDYNRAFRDLGYLVSH